MSSSTQITIQWTEPFSSGGCAITSYSILRDGGPLDSTFVPIHVAEVQNKPSLRNLLVTDLPQNVLGEIVKFKVKVTNKGGYTATSCEYLAVVIADIPSTPSQGPTSVKSFTNDHRIKIIYTEPYSGGSTLLNYEVVMDDG